MSLTPITDQDTEKLNDEIPDLFPACIVTRSKSYDMPTLMKHCHLVTAQSYMKISFIVMMKVLMI